MKKAQKILAASQGSADLLYFQNENFVAAHLNVVFLLLQQHQFDRLCVAELNPLLHSAKKSSRELIMDA